LLVFLDGTSFISTILYNQLVKVIPASNYVLVGVVNTVPLNIFEIALYELSIIKKKLFKIFGKNKPYNQFGRCTKYVDPNLLINAINVNDIHLIKKVKYINPDAALLIGCPQIFRKDLIKVCRNVVNYHNSLLPKYRGLEATFWSMYFNEKYTGFTFHYVDLGIDTGNILLQDKLEVDYSKKPYEVEIEKTILASKHLLDVLNLLSARFEGCKQEGEGSYFGKREMDKLQSLNKHS